MSSCAALQCAAPSTIWLHYSYSVQSCCCVCCRFLMLLDAAEGSTRQRRKNGRKKAGRKERKKEGRRRRARSSRLNRDRGLELTLVACTDYVGRPLQRDRETGIQYTHSHAQCARARQMPFFLPYSWATTVQQLQAAATGHLLWWSRLRESTILCSVFLCCFCCLVFGCFGEADGECRRGGRCSRSTLS